MWGEEVMVDFDVFSLKELRKTAKPDLHAE
jgi:hypothetical protein